LGVAKLSKVTVIAPRSDFRDVAKALGRFELFHPVEAEQSNFDPAVQELDVKAVRLFAQADQAVKDLSIPLMPGTIDIVFKGVRIPTTTFEAEGWDELLNGAERTLQPIVEETRVERSYLQRASKDETDALVLMNALQTVSGLSADLSGIANMSLFAVAVAPVATASLSEFRKSLPEALFVEFGLDQLRSLVLVAMPKSEEERMERVMKALEIKPLAIPPDLPQNPAEAYRTLSQRVATARKDVESAESRIESVRTKYETSLLAVRELTEISKEMLDEARISGSMNRLASISGYIPIDRKGDFEGEFSRWMIYSEPVGAHEEQAPTLMVDRGYLKPFKLVTTQQGTPGSEEVDPTPIVAFVFPIFFGMMFGDFGHGLIMTAVAILVRQRGTGNLKQWGNIFVVAGVSAMVFGAIFGEFFGLALYKFVPIPPLIEIINRSVVPEAPNIGGVELMMVIAILIGVAHLTTGLSLSIYEAAKSGETVELLVQKIPTLTMYLSGVGYGIAFVGASYSFDVLKPVGPAPLLGIPNETLGAISLAILLPSMLVLLVGRAIAVAAGKLEGETIAGALGNGGLEVFERISQFLSNTISYVRLAIMLLIHAVLLLIINEYFPIIPFTNPLNVVPWVFFNALILSFEALVVYVQDLRLHIYEFFTKFYAGKGAPFRKIVRERVRTRINWR